jgi:hypothetical protein
METIIHNIMVIVEMNKDWSPGAGLIWGAAGYLGFMSILLALEIDARFM